MNASSRSSSAHLRMRSPSPRPAPCHKDSMKEDSRQLKCPPPSPWSSSSTVSRQSPTSCAPQHSAPLPVNHAHSSCHPSPPSPRQSFLHPRTDPSQNFNNNNNRACAADETISGAIKARACSSSGSAINGRGPLTNGSHDYLCLHNRVPRPFSASEPNSRVQSPAPSPSPASVSHLYSPPPHSNYSISMASKPPHPRSGQGACRNSHNPLGLTLEIPKASSFSLTCQSPQILSPPPIGVSVNVWAHNVAAPQPRNPRQVSNSPISTSLIISPTRDNSPFPTSSPLFSLESSGTSSALLCPDAHQTASDNLQRSFSSSLADTHPGPFPGNHAGLRSCWQDSRQRQGSLDQRESCSPCPRSEWSSHSSSPSCLSPRAVLETPPSYCRPAHGKSSQCGQHFASVPWPGVQELPGKPNGTDGGNTNDSSASFSTLARAVHTCSPTSADYPTEWGNPKLEEGSCRTQLICAYVARPSQEQIQPAGPPPQVPSAATSPTPSVGATFSPSSSPLPFSNSKQKNHKSSYATTINLQIAGSGKITSFSTAHVSLTQTLQGGAGAPGQGQEVRRVSVNGLSLLPPPVPQL